MLVHPNNQFILVIPISLGKLHLLASIYGDRINLLSILLVLGMFDFILVWFAIFIQFIV